MSLPAEVAPKVAAVIVRRYLREHPISDEWGDTNVIMADILDDIISGEVGIT